MEFTYDGMVRYGFGFANPNHAAALICAILPFLWILIFSKGWKRWTGAGLSIIMLACLALTYSRAGIVVLIIEAGLFLLFYGRRYWKFFAMLLALFVVLVIAAKGMGRLSFDSAMSNRIDIWLGGISLFAKNPFGVGLGNSGEIVSAYMLPDGVACRTLVNSHLTLVCELGFVVGILWAIILVYLFFNNIPRKDTSAFRFASFASFAGLLMSAWMSTVFDWEVLFYPSKFPNMTLLNVLMEWLTFLLFLLITSYLFCRNFSKRTSYGSQAEGIMISNRNFKR